MRFVSENLGTCEGDADVDGDDANDSYVSSGKYIVNISSKVS